MSLNAKTLLESPDYFPLRFEGANLQFVRMSRDSYAKSIFTLPKRIVTDGTDSWSIPFAEIMQLVESYPQKSALPGVIFQIAHCGSTLLSRALDRAGSSLVIRESFALRQFAATPVIQQAPAQLARQKALAALWHLLGRQYQSNERVVLKANLPVNFSINEILVHAPDTAAILLYCSFEDYLIAVLKAAERQAWAKHVVQEMAAKIRVLKGFEAIQFDALTGAQAAAVLWGAQIVCYRQALARNQYLTALSSDTLFDNPKATIAAASRFLSVDLSESEVAEILAGDLFKQHAKLPQQSYSEAQRKQESNELRSKFAKELEEVTQWCQQLSLPTQADLSEYHLA